VRGRVAGAAQGDVLGEIQLASLYREGKGTAPDAAKAQFWTAQAQHPRDLAAWQRLNTKNGVGLSMMDVMGLMGEVWESLVSRKMSNEDVERMHLGEMQRQAAINRMH
jgi:hypothetical protein